MSVFRVPGDFPSIEAALASPLVARGDTILAREGMYNKVVVVPFRRAGAFMGDDQPEHPEVPEPPADDCSGQPVAGGIHAAGHDQPGLLAGDQGSESQPADPVDQRPSERETENGAAVPDEVDQATGPVPESTAAQRVAPPWMNRTTTIKLRPNPFSPFWATIRRRTTGRT